MKLFKSTLRLWITLSSLIGFYAGWAFLAHSPKPQPYVKPGQSLLGLEPVPSLSDLVGSGNNNNGPRVITPARAFAPRLRTGGS